MKGGDLKVPLNSHAKDTQIISKWNDTPINPYTK